MYSYLFLTPTATPSIPIPPTTPGRTITTCSASQHSSCNSSRNWKNIVAHSALDPFSDPPQPHRPTVPMNEAARTRRAVVTRLRRLEAYILLDQQTRLRSSGVDLLILHVHPGPGGSLSRPARKKSKTKHHPARLLPLCSPTKTFYKNYVC